MDRDGFIYPPWLVGWGHASVCVYEKERGREASGGIDDDEEWMEMLRRRKMKKHTYPHNDERRESIT